MSFPRYSAQVPVYYNEYSTGRPGNLTKETSRYQDCEIGPLFPFGYGLSYADIEYDHFEISNDMITGGDDPVKITFKVKNKSHFTTSEIVILYIEAKCSKTVRPVREMKKWHAVHLTPFETKQVSFELYLADLSYLNAKLEQVVEFGDFDIYINDLQQARFKLRYEERLSI